MSDSKRQSLVGSAVILVVATIVVKIIGALFKIPLTSLIGAAGRGYFSAAYNIYTPLYAISMAGLPIAVSRLTSENISMGQYKNAARIFSVSLKTFLLTGSIGTVAMLLFSYPYAMFIVRSPDSLPSILAIAPCVFLCCVISAYRGFYEGQRNMYPTAASQVIEAIGKLFLGLASAYAVKHLGMLQFERTGTVFGKKAASAEAAFEQLSPYAAASAIAGITIGTLAALGFLVIRRRFGKSSFSKAELDFSPLPQTKKEIKKALFAIAIPVVAGSLIANLTNLIDAATLQNRLAQSISAGRPIIEAAYSGVKLSGMSSDGLSAYLYGCYNSALDFKNLIPTLTQALGVSAIPALAGAWTLKDKKHTGHIISSVIRLTLLIALPAGIGILVLAKPVLSLLYGVSQPDIVVIAAPALSAFGFGTVFFALAAPLANMLQALGKTTVPVISVLIGGAVKILCNLILIPIPGININGAPYGSIACYAIITIINIIYILRQAKCRLMLCETILKPLLASTMLGAAAYSSYGLLTRLLSGNLATVAVILISSITYAAALYFLNIIKKEEILSFTRRKTFKRA